MLEFLKIIVKQWIQGLRKIFLFFLEIFKKKERKNDARRCGEQRTLTCSQARVDICCVHEQTHVFVRTLSCVCDSRVFVFDSIEKLLKVNQSTFSQLFKRPLHFFEKLILNMKNPIFYDNFFDLICFTFACAEHGETDFFKTLEAKKGQKSHSDRPGSWWY